MQIKSCPSSEFCICTWPSMTRKHLLVSPLPVQEKGNQLQNPHSFPRHHAPCSHSPLVAPSLTPRLLPHRTVALAGPSAEDDLPLAVPGAGSLPCRGGLPSLPLLCQRYVSILRAVFWGFFFQIFCKVDNFKIQHW